MSSPSSDVVAHTYVHTYETDEDPTRTPYQDTGGWTPIEDHTPEECASHGGTEIDGTYVIVAPFQATGNEHQDAHWLSKHAPNNAITIVGDSATGEIGEIRYPLEYQLHRRDILVATRRLELRDLVYTDTIKQPYKRFDWGDDIQFYVVASGWSIRAMSVITLLRQENWQTQDDFIHALIACGMRDLEAEYLNGRIQTESARRHKDPLRFGIIPC